MGELLLFLLALLLIVVIIVLIWMWIYVTRKPMVAGPTGPPGYPYSVYNLYGITGDNQTDWAPKLNNLTSSASNGLYLVFPPGGYILGSPWILNQPNIYIQGSPGTVFHRRGTGNITLSSNSCSLEFLTVNGGLLSGANILIQSGEQNTLSNVNSINSGGEGLVLSQSSFNSITSCTFSGNNQAGVRCSQSPDNRFYNNLIANNGSYGMDEGMASDRSLIVSNTIDNNTKTGGSGLGIDATADLVMDSNQVNFSASGSGILFYNQTGSSNRNIVTNNQVNNNGGAGIWLYNNPAGPYPTNYSNVTFNLLHSNGNNTVLNDPGNTGNAVIDNLTP